MERKYYLEDALNGQKTICFEENGRVWAIPADENNSDYLDYVASIAEKESK